MSPSSNDRNQRTRDLLKLYYGPSVHPALKQVFTVEGFKPENTVASIVHKDSPVCPEDARKFCETNKQIHIVMCGARAMISQEILKVPGKNGRPLYERTSQILSQDGKAGHVYVLVFEDNWCSISPVLWTSEPPKLG